MFVGEPLGFNLGASDDQPRNHIVMMPLAAGRCTLLDYPHAFFRGADGSGRRASPSSLAMRMLKGR